MEIIDTQILSFGFKEKIELDNKICAISSITASEFLLIYSLDPLSANYYIPHPNRYKVPDGEQIQIPSLMHPKWAKRAKRRTDIYTIEFNEDFPNLIEFGSQALSVLINERLLWLYDQVIQSMQKAKKKDLRKRMKYIIKKEITCIPLNSRIIDISFNILSLFLNDYNPKENFRNTYNDILILSTAIENKTKLITHDKLLNGLSVKIYGGIIKKENDFVQVDFSDNSSVSRKDSKESKGYINRGWQYKARKPIII